MHAWFHHDLGAELHRISVNADRRLSFVKYFQGKRGVLWDHLPDDFFRLCSNDLLLAIEYHIACKIVSRHSHLKQLVNPTSGLSDEFCLRSLSGVCTFPEASSS